MGVGTVVEPLGVVVTIKVRGQGGHAESTATSLPANRRTQRKPCFLLACQFDSSFLSAGGVVFPHNEWFQVTA
jgi:hypothetical protein